MVMKNKTTKIFLIRGLARETRHWGVFLDKMAESFAKATLHSLEIPGTGKLHTQTSPTTINDYVISTRRQYLAQIAKGDDCKIIGFSLGGMVAAHWLKHSPLDFSAAVLINTSFPISPFYKRMHPSGTAQLLLSFLSLDPYRREKRIATLLCNLANHEMIATDWAEIARTSPVSSINFLRQLYAAATLAPPVKTEVPTLIMSSLKDKLVSPQCSAEIATLWNCKLFIHDRAGHDLTTDDPDWCIRKLQSWTPFTTSALPHG